MKVSMKSQKGITLSTLVLYITIFLIVIAVMTTITDYFYKNVREIKEPLTYIAEFNKFSMFFINDVKNNKSFMIEDEYSETSESGTKYYYAITFEDGTKYMYSEGKIYRNAVEIAKNISQLRFTDLSGVVDGNQKNIINVQMIFGNAKGEDVFQRDVDFVLRYW